MKNLSFLSSTSGHPQHLAGRSQRTTPSLTLTGDNGSFALPQVVLDEIPKENFRHSILCSGSTTSRDRQISRHCYQSLLHPNTEEASSEEPTIFSLFFVFSQPFPMRSPLVRLLKSQPFPTSKSSTQKNLHSTLSQGCLLSK
jgi:hypothetical protein